MKISKNMKKKNVPLTRKSNIINLISVKMSYLSATYIITLIWICMADCCWFDDMNVWDFSLCQIHFSSSKAIYAVQCKKQCDIKCNAMQLVAKINQRIAIPFVLI